jgi:hypothetical protein
MAEVTSKLRRPGVSWRIAYPEAFANPAEPTVAELNNALLVKDISCAVDEDGTTFQIADSDTDDRLGYCDQSGVTRPTNINPEAVLAIYEDQDRNANGQFNLAKEHLLFPDSVFFLIKRVGPQSKMSDTPFDATDQIKMMRVRTDYGVPTIANDDPAMIVQTLLDDGLVSWHPEIQA